MVICPGGGYGHLAGHEGKDYALWLNEHGVSGFVLKYRLGTHGYRHPRMLEDAARAVRLTRSRAKEWGIDPKRVGIMGSSAGGHLAATLLTHFDAGKADATDPIERESCRPDWACCAIPSSRWGKRRMTSRRSFCLVTIPRPNWWRCCRTNGTSRRGRRRALSGPRMRIRRCRSRTACYLPGRCGRRACRLNCISTNTENTAWDWQAAIHGPVIACSGFKSQGFVK